MPDAETACHINAFDIYHNCSYNLYMDEPDGNYSRILPLRAGLVRKASGSLVILSVPENILGGTNEKGRIYGESINQKEICEFKHTKMAEISSYCLFDVLVWRKFVTRSIDFLLSPT